jgi:hypothetical protein
MKLFAKTALASFLVWVPLFGQSAQVLTLPHVLDGGGWQSTIVLTNPTLSTASVSLVFHQDISGGGGSQPWNPPFLQVSSTSGLVMVPGSSIYLQTNGTAAGLTEGWAEMDADAGVSAYVVFTNKLPAGGVQYDEGTAPAVAPSNRILVPYDDSNGFVTGIAIVNPTAADQSISVGFRTTDGLVAVSALPTLTAMTHTAFVLSQTFPVIAGHRGLAEFYSATGNISMIGLRFNPTQSFTAAPVQFESGPPIISVPQTDPGGGGSCGYNY